MTSYNDKNDAVANKDADGGAETYYVIIIGLILIFLCYDGPSNSTIIHYSMAQSCQPVPRPR